MSVSFMLFRLWFNVYHTLRDSVFIVINSHLYSLDPRHQRLLIQFFLTPFQSVKRFLYNGQSSSHDHHPHRIHLMSNLFIIFCWFPTVEVCLLRFWEARNELMGDSKVILFKKLMFIVKVEHTAAYRIIVMRNMLWKIYFSSLGDGFESSCFQNSIFGFESVVDYVFFIMFLKLMFIGVFEHTVALGSLIYKKSEL